MNWTPEDTITFLKCLAAGVVCSGFVAWVIRENRWLRLQQSELERSHAVNVALLQSAREGKVYTMPEGRPYEEADHSWRKPN